VWYARHRQWRFARLLGFGGGVQAPRNRATDITLPAAGE